MVSGDRGGMKKNRTTVLFCSISVLICALQHNSIAIFFKEFGQAMLLPLADEPAQSRSAKQPIEAGLEMLRGLPLEA